VESTELITEELAAFMRRGVVTFLGTTDAMGTPEVARATGIAPAGRGRLRLLISADATVTLTNLEGGSEVAVLVTDITDYRSVQWKGRLVEVAAVVTPGDLAMSDHNFEQFRAACRVVGVDHEQAWRMWPVQPVAVVVEVDELFDQTPGPQAGRTVVAGDPQR
jgi:nitroimidazol reductase NimA-like FMN-containing flavoprotein (pyridoxamine 5'-phosphate oxidase superfamily)